MRTRYIATYMLIFAVIGALTLPAALSAQDDPFVPSEVDFYVTLQDHKAALLWTFYGQLSAYGFTVERRDGLGAAWQPLGFVNDGLCVEGACSYQFTDFTLPEMVDGVYYRIKVHVGPDDGWYTHDVLLELNSIQPDEVTLLQNFPNPIAGGTADGVTSIRFHLPDPAHTTLEVFSSNGRTIATLIDEYKPFGTYTAEFHAGTLPAGVYFYRLSTPQTQLVKRMVVQK